MALTHPLYSPDFRTALELGKLQGGLFLVFDSEGKYEALYVVPAELSPQEIAQSLTERGKVVVCVQLHEVHRAVVKFEHTVVKP